MKKFLKNFPIETYVLLLPSLIFLLVMSFYIFFRENGYSEIFFHGHFLSIVISTDNLFPIIFIIICLNIIEILVMLRNQAKFEDVLHFLKSSFFVFGIFYISGLALTVLTQLVLNVANPTRTIASSIMFTKWDYTIFRFYPWLSLHSLITSHLMEMFIYESYLLTVVMMLVLLAILAFKNIFLFRKFLLSYFIAIVLATPFWAAFPALAPDMMYRLNIFNIPVPTQIADNLSSIHFSKTSQIVFSALEKEWLDNSGQSLPITTFPSMHAAWGIIIAVIGTELWTPLAIVLIPWFLLELTGTIFTLEHYAVDTIFGVLLGFLALYLATCLLRFDKKHSFNKKNLFVSLHQLQMSLSSFLSWIKSKAHIN
ncbi:MAG: phosphatase PAP2 family protein [Candidatus Pacebacteria bacterium]|nr:phosphatase PAP2 family protein [Candidatus Paceibacterota bacterium]